jgi:MFS transporter, UMF1 family
VDSKRVWGWYLFDWANQPYNTLLLTFIFAPYFAASVAPDPVTGQAMWGWMLAITGVVIALLAPILGAIADSAGPKAALDLLLVGLLCRRRLGALVGGAGDGPGAGSGPAGLRHRHDRAGVRDHLHQRAAADAGPARGDRAHLGHRLGAGLCRGVVSRWIIMLLFLAENDAGVTLLGNSRRLRARPGGARGHARRRPLHRAVVSGLRHPVLPVGAGPPPQGPRRGARRACATSARR